jgi:hypothetical protein
MDSARHDADSYERYSQYFNLLHSKIEEHEVEAENTYNMDEKGFMIGVIGKSKRIFDKVLFGKKQHKQSSHDGNREWVTVLASICGDGSTLPPCVIFPSPSGDVQQSWVREINPDLNDIHFATSHNGWTNNDLGLAWLKDHFDPLTKEKARRRYRLLIIDGHGSHVTKAFIDYCHENKILLFVFPPHATHTLQPLDVVCFKSLASNYSNELANQHQRRLGESPMNKGDFLTLFIPAWERTFTNKLVKQAFECTGIHPRNADVILDRFRTSTPQPPAMPPDQTGPHEASTEPDIHKFSTLVDRAVRDQNWDAANAVKQSFHQVLVRFELEKHEKEGLAEALQANKRKKKKRKVLPLQPTDPNVQGGAAIITPRAKVRADQDLKERERAELEKELAKTTEKQVKHQNKLLKALQKERNKVERDRKAKERAEAHAQERREIDARKAARAEAKALKDAQKASKLPKQAKDRALKKPQSKVTKRRSGAAVRRPQVVHKEPPPPPDVSTRSGRTTKSTYKLR